MPLPDGEDTRAREAAALQAAAAALGVAMDTQALDRLQRFLDLLERWNGTYNLTAVRDRAAMLSQHLLDCMAVLPALQRQLPGGGAVLDVGSGGGLPGVVLAILQPSLRVTCVDTVAKKVAFIRQAAPTLGLPNLEASHARVETLQQPQFDLITSRAFSSLPDFVRWTRASLAPGGVWMAMKGQIPADELRELPADIDVFHVEPLQVPQLDAERCLVWMKPR